MFCFIPKKKLILIVIVVSQSFVHSFSLVGTAALEERVRADDVLPSHVGVLFSIGVFEELVVFGLLLLLGGAVSFLNGAQLTLHVAVL